MERRMLTESQLKDIKIFATPQEKKLLADLETFKDRETILIRALDQIDTHGIAVEEVSHEELVEFISELKQITNDALIAVGERLPIKTDFKGG